MVHKDRGFTIPQFESFLRVNLLASRYDEIASSVAVVVTDTKRPGANISAKTKRWPVVAPSSLKEFTKKVNMDSALPSTAWFAKT